MFSNTKDVGDFIEVEGGRLMISRIIPTDVKWIGRFTDGSRRIVSIENTLGGNVTLDDNTTFLNPLASKYAGTMIALSRANARFERCHIESAQVCCSTDRVLACV